MTILRVFARLPHLLCAIFCFGCAVRLSAAASSGAAVPDVFELGAIGDGKSHPLATKFASLAAAKVDYPDATALSQELDWAAIQKALNLSKRVLIPSGTFVLNTRLNLQPGSTLMGESKDSSILFSHTAGPLVLSHGYGRITIRDLQLIGDDACPPLTGCPAPVAEIGIRLEDGDGHDSAQNVLDNLLITRFTVAGISLYHTTVTTISNSYIGYNVNSGTGVRLEDGYNNVIRLIGNYIRTSLVGVYVGSGATMVAIESAIESNGMYGVQIAAAANVIIDKSYFERNGERHGYDIYVSTGGGDDIARNVVVRDSIFEGLVAGRSNAYLQGVAGLTVESCIGTKPSRGGEARNMFQIGPSVSNLTVGNNEWLSIVTDSRQPLSPHGPEPENLLAAASDLRFGWAVINGSVSAPADQVRCAPNEMAAKLSFNGGVSADRPAILRHVVGGALNGGLIGFRAFVRTDAGHAVVFPAIQSGAASYLGSDSAQQHRITVDEHWREISIATTTDADDLGTVLVGIRAYPALQPPASGLYVCGVAAWKDSLDAPPMGRSGRE
jgi:hypothetical protein